MGGGSSKSKKAAKQAAQEAPQEEPRSAPEETRKREGGEVETRGGAAAGAGAEEEEEEEVGELQAEEPSAGASTTPTKQQVQAAKPPPPPEPVAAAPPKQPDKRRSQEVHRESTTSAEAVPAAVPAAQQQRAPPSPPSSSKDPPNEEMADEHTEDAASGKAVDSKKQKKKRLLNGTNIDFKYPSGSKYLGGFKDGKLHGFGKYTYYPSGDDYEGEWWNDMKHGHGKYTYESGDKYVGEWKYGKKHGKGNYTFASGDEYVGSWKADRIHGYGLFLIVRNGNRYEGEWEDSYRHGFGVLLSGNGDRYEGHWVRGKEEGNGVLSYASGNHYCGEWKLGQMDGKGVLIEKGVRFLVEHISGYMISNTAADPNNIDPDWAAVWNLSEMHLKKLKAKEAQAEATTGTRKLSTASVPQIGLVNPEADSAARAEILKLKKENEALEAKYEELLKMKNDVDTVHEAENATIDELKEKMKELVLQAQVSEQRIKDYQAKEETNKAVAQELSYAKEKLADANHELETLRKEAEDARSGFVKSPVASPAAAGDGDETSVVAGLENQLREMQQKLKLTENLNGVDVLELQARLELAETTGNMEHIRENQDLKKRMEALQEAEVAWKQREEELLGQIESLKNELEDVGKQMESAKVGHGAKLEELNTEKDAKIRETEEKAKKNKRKAKEFDAKLKVAEEELKNAKLASEEAQQELKAQADEFSVLQTKVAELAQSADEATQLQEQVKLLQSGNAGLSEENVRLGDKAEKLAEEFKAEKTKARKLFNTIEDMKGKIRVYARTRPFLESETERSDKNVLKFPEDMAITVFDDEKMKEKKEFLFDSTFPAETSQEKVFEDCKHLIQSAVDGFNVCIFAYGQTGSGKTFTLAGTQEDPGVAPRSMQELFAVLDTMAPTHAVKVSCYMVELYNDKLYDLFRTEPGDAPRLDIKKDIRGTVAIQGVTINEARDLEELSNLYVYGQKNRHTRATKMNDASSRSHLVFSILIETTGKGQRQDVMGKLSIVDLAGSERLAKTGVEDPTAVQEAQSINLSLTALGNVISALSTGKGHVPYRDNKLTMLMSDSLGGNAKTLMFVNISPSSYNTDETTNSLNYASRVKLIKNSPAKAVETTAIKRLKAAIEKLKQGVNVDVDFQEIEDRGENDDDAEQSPTEQPAPTGRQGGRSSQLSIGDRKRQSRTPSPLPQRKSITSNGNGDQ